MGSYYLVTYRPLAFSRVGRDAAERANIPPFVDASCRREPDLEAPHPSITALCRGHLFVPRLVRGDTVAYITKKGRYGNCSEDHWRLVAVLRVMKSYSSHLAAANWYRQRGEDLPSNCMVSGNRPKPLRLTDKYESTICGWDSIYRDRAKQDGDFAICRALFRRLHRPPVLRRQDFESVFEKLPATLNPPPIKRALFVRLCRKAGLSTEAL